MMESRSRKAGVGTIIFDPDGEYFWPDAHGRPGLCDVPELTERLVVFTAQQAPSAAYQSFVVDQVKLDIRQLSAQRVLGIALPAERQDQQNVTKLKSLGTERWTRLVDLIAAHRYDVDPAEIRKICGIKPANEEQQTNAIIGKMVRVVDALHDPSSQMLRALKTALGDGKLCVVDISQLRGQRGLHLASIVLAEIFAHNASEFTKATPQIIPCIAVVEEAQAVLGAGGTAAEDGPFVSWVKEGRKYGLGAVLVTQQPGSIPAELTAQALTSWVLACQADPMISSHNGRARAIRMASATSSSARRVRFIASSAKTELVSSPTVRPGRTRSSARTVCASSSRLKTRTGLSNKPTGGRTGRDTMQPR